MDYITQQLFDDLGFEMRLKNNCIKLLIRAGQDRIEITKNPDNTYMVIFSMKQRTRTVGEVVYEKIDGRMIKPVYLELSKKPRLVLTPTTVIQITN